MTATDLIKIEPLFANLLNDIRSLPKDVCSNAAWHGIGSGKRYDFKRIIKHDLFERGTPEYDLAICLAFRALRVCHLKCCG